MLQAVVFDFDGVLVNSEPLHFRALQQIMAPRGVSISEDDYYERYLGLDDEGAFELIAREQGWELGDGRMAALVREKSRLYAAIVESAGEADLLFPGAADCVRRIAARVPVAIASGALPAEIHLMLRLTRLGDFFRAIVGAGDTPASKPAPDPYRHAVELLAPHINSADPGSRIPDPGSVASGQWPVARSVGGGQWAVGRETPSGIVAIEDSRWGLESARAAGLRCVAVTHTYPADELPGADLIVSSLDEIDFEVLNEICRR